ncbi:hypothetical protein Cni_G11483 [Canna indica]|uniref:F-box domain-containing protein n=1 Tax=Canna indica TaxID=4628 RepID=A0AAQ3K7W4_9LILI|nr:hypothetical protein Cni_G11483 [Canna indica]
MSGPSRDILFCILSRLPLKSVMQYCCVSKLWFDVIKSPEFRDLHSTVSPPDPTLLLLSRRLLRGNVISISPMKISGHHLYISDNSITNFISSSSWNLVGACNGFICFVSFDHEQILVCNPITRELVTLPKPTTAYPPDVTTIYGFGFDSSSGKYKVICVSYSNELLHNDANTRVSAKVCTLGSAGSWRAVADFPQPPSGLPVFANGFLHWSVFPEFFIQERIISFDVGKEEAAIRSHPNFGLGFSIAELGRCLSVVDFRRPTLIEVWVLRDEISNYWQQEYILPTGVPYGVDMRFPRLLSIFEKDDVLLIWLQDSVFSYEKRTLSRKKLLISGLPSWLDWDICYGYKASLAPLNCNPEEMNEGMDVAYFKSDMQICSQPALSSLIVESKTSGKCDGLISCFVKNCMLSP